MLDQMRNEILEAIRQYRYEVKIMNAFVRDNTISVRSYKRRYRTHKRTEL